MRYILLLCVVLVCGSCTSTSSFSKQAYRIASDPSLTTQEKMVQLKMIEISMAETKADAQLIGIPYIPYNPFVNPSSPYNYDCGYNYGY